jgi:hypothetical protein
METQVCRNAPPKYQQKGWKIGLTAMAGSPAENWRFGASEPKKIVWRNVPEKVAEGG